MRPARPLAVLSLLACLGQAAAGFTEDKPRQAPPLPADPSRWVGEPISWNDLRGRVTLVFVWTFG